MQSIRHAVRSGGGSGGTSRRTWQSWQFPQHQGGWIQIIFSKQITLAVLHLDSHSFYFNF